MAFIAQFEEFWKNANLSLEMPDDAKKPMFDAWSKINWPKTTVSTDVSAVASATKPEVKGKVSGYNLFMRDLSIELKKDTSISGADRMKIIASRWKSITPDEKKVWQDKAKSASAGAVVEAGAPVKASTRASRSNPKEKTEAKSKSPRKLSVYNLFMKSTMAKLKEQGVPSNERMKQIGPMWRELSDDQKKNWTPTNDAAVPAEAEAEAEADVEQ